MPSPLLDLTEQASQKASTNNPNCKISPPKTQQPQDRSIVPLFSICSFVPSILFAPPPLPFKNPFLPQSQSMISPPFSTSPLHTPPPQPHHPPPKNRSSRPSPNPKPHRIPTLRLDTNTIHICSCVEIAKIIPKPPNFGGKREWSRGEGEQLAGRWVRDGMGNG